VKSEIDGMHFYDLKENISCTFPKNGEWKPNINHITLNEDTWSSSWSTATVVSTVASIVMWNSVTE
jgi:hypothetical protein